MVLTFANGGTQDVTTAIPFFGNRSQFSAMMCLRTDKPNSKSSKLVEVTVNRTPRER